MPERIGGGHRKGTRIVRWVLRLHQRGIDLLARRPQISQVDFFAAGSHLHWIHAQVALRVACKRKGNNEGRRHQEAKVEIGMHTPRKIPVAREHGDRMDRPPGHRLLNGLRQWTGVADACRAAVADDVEADGRQVLGEAGTLQVGRCGG
ncbi:hypothetical protein D3C86_1738170 [compost metagenome]